MYICKTCLISKPIEEYHTTGKNRTRKHECKQCINARRKEARKNNLEKCRAQDKQRYVKDREKRLEAAKIYARANKEKRENSRKAYAEKHRLDIKVKSKQYYEANKEKIRANAKNYYNKNKEYLKASKQAYLQTEAGRLAIKNGRNAYKARKKSTDDKTVTISALQNLAIAQNNQCSYCKCPIDIADRSVHLDHYIPLSKGGAHSITNVVWACAKCNLRKNDKLPKDFK